MDILLAVKAIIMGLVEGFTEFLPISSTGHLILAGSLLNFTGDKVKVFEIAIQAGAMLAVIWEYRQRIANVATGLGSAGTSSGWTRSSPPPAPFLPASSMYEERSSAALAAVRLSSLAARRV